MSSLIWAEQALPADAGELAADLRRARSRLCFAVLASRPLAAAAALMVLVGRRSAVGHAAVPLGLAWACYLAFAAASAIGWRRVRTEVRARPWLLLLEQSALVGLLLAGGQVRAITVYACAAPVVFATIEISIGWALALATADSAVVAGVFLLADRLGTSVGTEPPNATVWAPALVGLYAAIGLFVYVRVLFERLEAAGEAARERHRALLQAHAEHARAEAQEAALVEFAGRVSSRVPQMLQAIERLDRRQPADAGWQEQVAALRRLAGGVDQNLERLIRSRGLEEPPARAADVITQAAAAVVALGADGVRCSADGIAGPALSPDCAGALRRFVTEAVTNAWKHGRAPIDVELQLAGAEVAVTVRDHGPGFDGSHDGERGLGLVSLARDAAELRGTLSIGLADPGTRVTLRMPADG